jgi:adenylylsulfate kinase
MDAKARNIHWHEPSVTIEHRRETFQYRSCIIWFTGLSAAGKSTLANDLCRALHDRGIRSYVLDGDNVRHGLNRDLGFNPADRKENIRRIGEVAKLFVDAGLIVLTAFISPFREHRDNVRKLVKDDEFIEVYVKCPLDECEKRDPKGIYRKVRSGEIKEFTGISSPYEEPFNPDLIIDTEVMNSEECVEAMLSHLIEKEYIRKS